MWNSMRARVICAFLSLQLLPKPTLHHETHMVALYLIPTARVHGA
jgi:hypothetical protein